MLLKEKNIENVDTDLTKQQILYFQNINADSPKSYSDNATIENWLKTNPFLENLWRMLQKIGTPVPKDILTAPQTKAAVLLEMGYTCREVNEKLELPAGTVLKWVQNTDKSESPFLKIVELQVTDMAKNIETTKKERPILTAAEIKQKVDTQLKRNVAFAIGAGQTIGDVIQDIIFSLTSDCDFDNSITMQNIESLLREAFRTCNPNDKKFNVKKYGDVYRAGCRAMVQDIGNGVMTAFRTYIKTLNQNLSTPLFSIDEKITIKEYAAIGKDLAAAASLFQSIAQAHQPNSENTFNILPALDSQLISAEIEAEAAEIEIALPAAETPKALVSDSSGSGDTD